MGRVEPAGRTPPPAIPPPRITKVDLPRTVGGHRHRLAGRLRRVPQAEGNNGHDDIDAQIDASSRPKKLNSGLNILLTGSDGRGGANARATRCSRSR